MESIHFIDEPVEVIFNKPPVLEKTTLPGWIHLEWGEFHGYGFIGF